MQNRPFINESVDALEQLFLAAANDIGLLRLLADELQHRKKPRAIALRRKVKTAVARHPDGGVEPIRDDELPLEPLPARAEVEVQAEDEPKELNGFEEEFVTFECNINEELEVEPTLFDITDLTDGEIEASEPIEVVAAPIKNKPADIVESWTALEVLSPQTYKQPADLRPASPPACRLRGRVSGSSDDDG